MAIRNWSSPSYISWHRKNVSSISLGFRALLFPDTLLLFFSSLRLGTTFFLIILCLSLNSPHGKIHSLFCSSFSFQRKVFFSYIIFFGYYSFSIQLLLKTRSPPIIYARYYFLCF